MRLLILFAILAAASASFNLPSPWTFKCDRNVTSSRCIKEEKSGVGEEGMSLSACKLTCGKDGALWPKPQSAVIGDRLSYFVPAIITKKFTASPEDQVLLEAAFQVFLTTLHQYHPEYQGDDSIWSPGLNSPLLSSFTINVELSGSKSRLGLDTADEQYTLRVSTVEDAAVVTISASTFFGARHALETLSQLIDYEESTDSLQIVSAAEVTDAPAFAFRGILLDTARNYYTVKEIEGVLDAMSYNKLNTFHWHITESNSFPIVMQSLPQMSYYGAHSGRQVYYPEDIRRLVEYGRIRGIRVLPEFDAPAHVGNGWQWGPKQGLGELAVCVNQEPWQKYCVQPPCGQLNIANENIYPVLEKIYREMVASFGPLDIFHYGGDEVNVNCWNTTQEIVEWMLQQRLPLTDESYYDKWSNFQNRAFEAFTRANSDVEIPGIVWTSHLTEKNTTDKYLDRNKYIIQIWSTGEDPLIAELLQKNFRVIFSNYDAWYFDCGFGAWVGEGNNWCSPYKGWQAVYDNNPVDIAKNLTGGTANLDLILGGEACLWSEQSDGQAVDSRLWPRGAALAERLWSNPEHGWGPAETRMVNHRQRMVQRGIRADRLQPEWCHQNEGLCYINK